MPRYTDEPKESPSTGVVTTEPSAEDIVEAERETLGAEVQLFARDAKAADAQLAGDASGIDVVVEAPATVPGLRAGDAQAVHGAGRVALWAVDAQRESVERTQRADVEDLTVDAERMLDASGAELEGIVDLPLGESEIQRLVHLLIAGPLLELELGNDGQTIADLAGDVQGHSDVVVAALVGADEEVVAVGVRVRPSAEAVQFD